MFLSKHGRCILLALVLGGTEVKARGLLGGSDNGLPDTSGDTDTTSVDIESSQKGEDSGRNFLRKLMPVISARMPVLGPREDGYCVKADGSDQNSGVVQLLRYDANTDWNTKPAQQKCLEACFFYNSVVEKTTGCEVIWNQDNQGCYAMTEGIAGGNGVDNHYCWLLSDDDNDFPVTPGDMPWSELLEEMDNIIISFPTSSDVTNLIPPTDALTNAPVDCGAHYAPNCRECPYDAFETYMGSAWCNGNCHWCNGECQSSVCP